jgi:hypothetical protein
MKFKAIVGNPPYQVMDGGGAGTSAVTIYNIFVDVAKKIGPTFISMIIPARWYAGGKGLDDFRNKMLNDRHFICLFDFPESKEVFPSADIAGGICYFLRNSEYDGECSVTSVVNGHRSTNIRLLSQYDTFIRHAEAVNIIEKVNRKAHTFLSDIVYSRKPFGLDNNYRGQTQPYPGCILLYGSYGISYISTTEVKQNVEAVKRWKVIASKASAQGGRADKDGMRKVIPKVEVLPPNSACTESYLLIYDFDNRVIANRAASYIRSKLFRFLLSLSVITQNISRESFRFVPLQDFTENSDIDWSRSVAEIDRQLYEKYGLSEEEIAFIESMIKPM